MNANWHVNLGDTFFKQVEKQPSVSDSQQSESDLYKKNTSQLVEQHNDPEIELLFQGAIDEEEAKHS